MMQEKAKKHKMHKKHSRLLLALACLSLLPLNVDAQTTVGNGTVTPLSAGQKEAYGINYLPSDNSASQWLTRHYKRGNDTGIGGSTIDTTSPTSESSPAIRPLQNVSIPPIRFNLPNLPDNMTTMSTSSPALNPLSTSMPGTRHTNWASENIPQASFGGSSWSQPSFSVEPLPGLSGAHSPLPNAQFETLPRW